MNTPPAWAATSVSEAASTDIKSHANGMISMNNDSQRPKLIVYAISLYLGTVICAAAFYNWQFAQNNGFVKWIFLGELVPSAKALAWPYFAFDVSDPSPEDLATARYFVTMTQAIEEYQRQEPFLISESARIAEIFDAREKVDPNGARQFLADSMEVLLAGVQPTLGKIVQIKPPKELREHYSLVLGCPKTQVEAIMNIIAALRQKNAPLYAAEMNKLQLSLSGCTGTKFWDHIHGSLERAGFHSPDDIDRAVANGDRK
jgi:hypothetical protein